MKRNLKIFLTWAMSALMAYNIVGYIFVFELADIVNRENVESRLSNADDSQVMLLKVSDISSVIRKGDHEIVFNGNHYDIKKEITKDGCTYFYCIHDKAEESLYAGLSASVSSNSEAPAGHLNMHGIRLLKSFVKEFFFQHLTENTVVTSILQSAFNFNESFSSIFSPSIITPPPQALVA